MKKTLQYKMYKASKGPLSDAAAYEMFSLFVLHTVCSLHQKERLFLTVPRPCLLEPMQY